ncbi:MAG: translation initiation factor IF-2, partial [Bacillota bacterium]
GGKGGGRTLSSRRRGPDGRRGEAMEKLKEYTEADLIERRDRLAAASSYRAGFDSDLKKKAGRGTHTPAKSPLQKGGAVKVTEPVTIRNLSAALGVKSNELMMKLMRQGVMANINQALDADTAAALALDYGVELSIQAELSLEEQLEKDLTSREVKPENLVPRPPVVTILGHVDHGKTSLLDKIRKTNVAAGEAGGITQHVAAWTVELNGKRVTFIDTPGHQAFTSMRARGANMTDVVVLVVSAAEGVQPQTIESINHARAAKVPIVVALNKIDRPDANPDMVLGQLAKEGLNPVEWGGDTEVVRTSAVTGKGIPELIDILYYQADLLELKADPTAPARGMVIESRMDDGLGPVATVLVQNGTLKVGDIGLSGGSYGRIRSLLNDRSEMIESAGPATPVIISGLNDLPNAGDKFVVVEDLDRARTVAEDRQNRIRQSQLANQNKVTVGNLLATMKADEIKTINLIIKADVQGSIETLSKTVTEYNTDEVKVQVIHAAVGEITESDVELAAATRDENSNTVIIGFHVVPDEAARQLAEQRGVEIRLYRVIYEIFDDLKKALSGMLEPEIREKLHGHAEIRQIFKVSRVGNIAGCMVTDGHIQRGSKIRLIRNGVVVVNDLSLESLKRQKDDVKEVKAGFECGLKIAGYDDIKIGDRIEAYVRETIRRTL